MIEQRVAVVTGAATGIGQAIAKRLAQDGHCVAIADRDEAAGVEVARDIDGSTFFVSVNVSDPDLVAQMVKSGVGRTGQLDILVNNAGIAGIAAPVINYPIEDWHRVLSVNLDGVFYCCRVAVPHMFNRRWGRVVNGAPIAGKEGNPNMSAYSSAKASQSPWAVRANQRKWRLWSPGSFRRSVPSQPARYLTSRVAVPPPDQNGHNGR